MNRRCCCASGDCSPDGETTDLTRRQFLRTVAAGAAGVAAASDLLWPENTEAGPVPALIAPRLPKEWRYPLTPPRVYQGKNLEALSMPLGGIGVGSLWLDGQGRLGIWQIFNNLDETRLPNSFFAVAISQKGRESLRRVLQTVPEGNLQPLQSLTYEGGYPIARLKFEDSDLPVEMLLEAFNPMIPTDAANSSIPCAIFRLTARNTTDQPVEVSFLGSLQNGVGSVNAGQEIRLPGYGFNRNRVIRERNLVSVSMDKAVDPMVSGLVKVRKKTGEEVPGPELHWLSDLPALTPEAVDPMARIMEEGGVVLVAGAHKGFFDNLTSLRKHAGDLSALATVFKDFERSNYEGWTITGEAFGKRPSRGTEPSQQPVSGFVGKGLVNTFIAGDGPQGVATSKPFQIDKRYIGFLIGGGNHPNETCINLRVDDKVVRTATGKDAEALEPTSWDVAEFRGKTGVLEIVDWHSGGWGHINIDQIVFSDVPPESLVRQGTTADSVAKAIGLPFGNADTVTLSTSAKVAPTNEAPVALKHVLGDWHVTEYTRLQGYRSGEVHYRTLATAPNGDPLLIEGPMGKGRIIFALAAGLPWSVGSAVLADSRGERLRPGESLVRGDAGWGSMALVALEKEAQAMPGWVTVEELINYLTATVWTGPVATQLTSGPGGTLNGALGVRFSLKPGAERTVTFAITWHFPNVQRFQHAGNVYSRRWPDAMAVARYVAENAAPLWERTKLYHETVYQSNLPEEFLDAITSQSVIFRGPTCFWSEDGYFGGFEGSYGCCPLNCTHVWNYAQSHARLFPEIGRNMRVSDFLTYLHATGETSHRQHAPHNAFIDGHCACIEAALREHQLSPDLGFLEKIWPGLQKAVDWLIEAVDKDRDGIPSGHQWNTYDTAVSGANTFIGSQYLSALAAGEKLALVMGDEESADSWRAVRESGMKNQNEKLWNGEYYIQTPGPQAASDYNNGCHADQLLGQWWAHSLNAGYLYPKDRVRSALQSVMRYNFKEQFAGIKQDPRRYIPDDEGGLMICTWPHNDRPNPWILYADEVWTGIEYATAGLMVYEGLIEEARRIVRMARGRYDGRRRDGLNSGPGGNPYNELECGKFYARAMSSWSLLIASQGLILEGPRGILGFKPRWQPEDHRSFFTAPESWGLFVQRRRDNLQTDRIEIRHGRLKLKELVFELPPEAPSPKAALQVGNRRTGFKVSHVGDELRILLDSEVVVSEGEAAIVSLSWWED